MSLYNQLFGVHPLARDLMMIIGLGPDDVGRFRDCYAKHGEPGQAPTIVIFTRNGGGNRDEYHGVFEALRGHPLYLRDWDDDFDCTYASIEFRVPPLAVTIVEVMLAVLEAQAPESLREPMQRFRDLQTKLAAGNTDDADVKRALDVGRRIFGKLDEAMKDGGGGIVDV